MRIIDLIETIFTAVGVFFQTFYLRAEVIVDRLIELGDEELNHFRNMLIAICIMPPFIFVAGILISCFGNWVDWIGLISFGRKVMAFSGILFALTALYVWARMYVLGQLLVIASYAISKIPIPRLTDTGPSPGFHAQARDGVVSGGLTAGTHLWWDHPDVLVKTEDVMKYLRILMGLMFWLTFVVIYACVFPVYVNLLYFMVVLLGALALGFATVHWKIETPWLKRLSLAFLVLVILFASFNYSQSITATKSLEHHERMQRIYQKHHGMLSWQMEKTLNKQGVLRAEKDPEYRVNQRKLALLENRMGMKGRLFAYLKRHAISAPDEWNDLADQFVSGDKQTVMASTTSTTTKPPDPSTEGTPLTVPIETDSIEPEEEPELAATPAAKPKVSSANKSKLQAFLKGMDEDKKKRDELKQRLKDMNL